MMPKLPILLPAQKTLLIELVEAAERVPPAHRTHFLVYTLRGGDRETSFLEHPGMHDQPGINFSDIEILAHNQLLLLSGQPETSHKITLLPEAYVYYGLIKRPALLGARVAVREVLADTLMQARRALRVLELSAARYGSVGLPPNIALEIEDKLVEVVELERRLKELDEEDDREAS